MAQKGELNVIEQLKQKLSDEKNIGENPCSFIHFIWSINFAVFYSGV